MPVLVLVEPGDGRCVVGEFGTGVMDRDPFDDVVGKFGNGHENDDVFARQEWGDGMKYDEKKVDALVEAVENLVNGEIYTPYKSTVLCVFCNMPLEIGHAKNCLLAAVEKRLAALKTD